MRRAGALFWLGVVVLLVLYLAARLSTGLVLQSNILALLPRSDQDPAVQRVQDRITDRLSRQVVVLVGHRDPATALNAARMLSRSLVQSGLTVREQSMDNSAAERQLARIYFSDRAFLLSDHDRDLLLSKRGETLVRRALSFLYGPGGLANGQLVSRDPFFLFPSFLADLPLPHNRIALLGDQLSVRDGGMTFILVNLTLAGDPYSIGFQDRFISLFDPEESMLSRMVPGLRILRTGAIFYAQASTSEAMRETSIIGIASMLGMLMLIFFTFRQLRPIILGFLAITTGIVCAFAGTLFLFGNMHVVALLFGVSLIGISVDYCLQYFCEYFDPGASTPSSRLVRVLPGVALGVGTTLIGYLTLLLAPFPGLRQVATFSVIGLSASFLSVMLWFPFLDAERPPDSGRSLVRLANNHWVLWQEKRYRSVRWSIAGFCILLGAIGAFFIHVDDDVHHLQSLSVQLRSQELEIRRLAGFGGDAQFVLVRAPDEESALEQEEALLPLLKEAQHGGFVQSYQSLAQFVPSEARQQQNWNLIRTRLMLPYMKEYRDQIGYRGSFAYNPPPKELTAADLPHNGPLAALSMLDVTAAHEVAHVVLLKGLSAPQALQAMIARTSNARLVDPAGNWSRLFGTYRRYAIGLLVLSAVLMYPMLAWRYGWITALRVMAPSVAAAGLTPFVLAALGIPLTFFNAMALVLILSIGVDYSVFCRETFGERKPVTMLAVGLAALGSTLTFGLLALSNVFAVRAFGLTMLIGIFLAFFFAPAAGDGEGSVQGSRAA